MNAKYLCIVLFAILVLLLFCNDFYCCDHIENFKAKPKPKPKPKPKKSSSGSCDCEKCSNIVNDWLNKGWYYNTDDFKSECTGCPTTKYPEKFNKNNAKCK